MRYELFDRISGEFKLRHISSYDGARSAQLFDPKQSREYPAGFVYDLNRCEDVATWDTQPVRWTFAAMEPDISHVPIRKLSVRDANALLDGSPSVLLERELVAPPGMVLIGGSLEQFWIDPAQGYSIVRFSRGYAQHIDVQMDCVYQRDEEHGCWIPQEWTSWRFRADGSPFEVAHSKVTSYEILPKLGDDVFSVKFPPGTVARDWSRPGNSQTGSYDYLVLKDGSERPITWDERLADYEALLANPSGTARGPAPTRVGAGWLIKFNLIALTAIAGLWFLKSRRVKRPHL
jgi:hypothetical protein